MNENDTQNIDQAADEEARAKASGEAEAQAGLEDDQARAEATVEAPPAFEDGRILGVSTRHYPAQASVIGHRGFILPDDGYIDQSEDPPPTVVVLVQGRIGDYAAYAGHGKPEWVRAHGDKIRFEEACIHFPSDQLRRELYRD